MDNNTALTAMPGSHLICADTARKTLHTTGSFSVALGSMGCEVATLAASRPSAEALERIVQLGESISTMAEAMQKGMFDLSDFINNMD
jgi:hypothetical protein